MSERIVTRGEDAPVEQVTRAPGQKRDTGQAGPRRGDSASEDEAAFERDAGEWEDEDVPRHRLPSRDEIR